jgi:hypothetical protein
VTGYLYRSQSDGNFKFKCTVSKVSDAHAHACVPEIDPPFLGGVVPGEVTSEIWAGGAWLKNKLDGANKLYNRE